MPQWAKIFQFWKTILFASETTAFIREKNRVARNEKKKKKLYGFSYSKSMANYEVFNWSFLSSTNLLFLKIELSGLKSEKSLYIHTVILPQKLKSKILEIFLNMAQESEGGAWRCRVKKKYF